MKKNKRSLITYFLVVVLLVCALVWITNVIRTNNNYYDDILDNNRTVGVGEWLEFDDIKYMINNVKIYDIEAFVSEYSEFYWLESDRYILEGLFEEGEDLRILCYILRVETGDKQQDSLPVLPSGNCSISGLWNNAECLTLLNNMNDEENMEIGLNSYTEIIVPVCMYKSHFSDKDWKLLTEKNPELELVVEYQPKRSSILLNKSEYITATEEDKEYFNDIMARVAEIEGNVDDSLTVLDENVFYNGSGTIRGLSFEIHEFGEVTPEDIKEKGYYAYTDADFWIEQGDEVRLITAQFTIRNETEELYEFNANSTRIEVYIDDKGVAGYELIGVVDPPRTDTKSNYLYVLEPGESVTIDAEYMCMWSGGVEELTEQTNWALEQKDSYYFSYNPSGQYVNSLNSKIVLFINIGDLWR